MTKLDRARKIKNDVYCFRKCTRNVHFKHFRDLRDQPYFFFFLVNDEIEIHRDFPQNNEINGKILDWETDLNFNSIYFIMSHLKICCAHNYQELQNF